MQASIDLRDGRGVMRGLALRNASIVGGWGQEDGGGSGANVVCWRGHVSLSWPTARCCLYRTMEFFQSQPSLADDSGPLGTVRCSPIASSRAIIAEQPQPEACPTTAGSETARHKASPRPSTRLHGHCLQHVRHTRRINASPKIIRVPF